MSASDEPPEPPREMLDLRLLVPAAAGWLAAVVLVGQQPLAGLVTAAVSLGLACLVAVFLRARFTSMTRAVWAVVGMLVVVAGMGVGAALQVTGLRVGPVQGLATDGATVGVRLRIDGDPAVRRS